jgi:hypothetical protein
MISGFSGGKVFSTEPVENTWIPVMLAAFPLRSRRGNSRRTGD